MLGVIRRLTAVLLTIPLVVYFIVEFLICATLGPLVQYVFFDRIVEIEPRFDVCAKIIRWISGTKKETA